VRRSKAGVCVDDADALADVAPGSVAPVDEQAVSASAPARARAEKRVQRRPKLVIGRGNMATTVRDRVPDW